MYMSSCSGITTVKRNRATRLPSHWRAACNFPCWQRKVRNMPSRKSGKSSMFSPAFAIIASSTPPAGCWPATASATSRLRRKWCACLPTFPKPPPTRSSFPRAWSSRWKSWATSSPAIPFPAATPWTPFCASAPTKARAIVICGRDRATSGNARAARSSASWH